MRSLVRILTSTRELWPYYVGITVCTILVAAAGLATPFIVSAAVSTVVSGRIATEGISVALWLAGALLIAELTVTLVSNVGGYLGDVMSVRLRAALSSRYYAKLLRLPQRYFDAEVTGTVINRLSRSIAETTGFLNMFANNFLQMVLTVVAVLGITAYYSWPIALLLATIYPVFGWLTTATSGKWQDMETVKNHEFDVAGGRFAEVVAQIRVVKSFGQEYREREVFDQHYATAVGVTHRQSRYWHRMDVSRRAVLNLIYFVVFAVLFVQTARGTFTVATMVLLVQLVMMARQPVAMMSYLVDSTQRAIVGSKDYFEVLAEPEESTEPAPRETPRPGGGGERVEVVERGEPGAQQVTVGDTRAVGIDYRSVSFGYGAGEPVLRDVSFSIAPGEHVAFVGESGGGKTTLVNLLLRFYEPDAGSVHINGIDIATMTLAQVRAEVGMVFQDPALFSGTIRENIAYSDPTATMEQVAQAARLAHVDPFVSKLVDGYDSQIGERGIRLSGGQKQRIAVSRAMLKNAPVLVLDEATSSLDSRSERLVQEGLDRLTAGRTTIIIAHRLSTISAVDRIVTLRDGTVDEIGSPAELAHSGGIYSELLALQSSTAKRDRQRLQQFDIRA